MTGFVVQGHIYNIYIYIYIYIFFFFYLNLNSVVKHLLTIFELNLHLNIKCVNFTYCLNLNSKMVNKIILIIYVVAQIHLFLFDD